MAKVTSKLQLTVPKAIAEQYNIRPGDELDWLPAGDAIRVRKSETGQVEPESTAERLHLFDQATARQRAREGQSARKNPRSSHAERGWTREELYDRGLSR